MIVEATGTATGGNNPNSARIHKAMDDAAIKANAEGVNDPAAVLERKLKARADIKAKIARENHAAQVERAVKDITTSLEAARNMLKPTADARLLNHINAVEEALIQHAHEAFRRI